MEQACSNKLAISLLQVWYKLCVFSCVVTADLLKATNMYAMRTYFLARLYIGYCFSKTLKRGSEQRVGHQTHTLSTGKISTMLLQNQAITCICQLRQTCMPWRVLALRKAWKVAKCCFIYSCFSCSCYYHSLLVKT